MNNSYAFPAMHIDLAEHEHGMTLRDYFAAHSIQTAMFMVKHDFENEGTFFNWDKNEREIVASRAYTLADAMLEARDKT
jgi:hypothetical protein